MEKEKINQFIMINGKFFPEMMFEDVKQKLESLDESKESMLMATEWKNPTVAFLFAFFLGGLGVDRLGGGGGTHGEAGQQGGRSQAAQKRSLHFISPCFHRITLSP